MHPLRRAARAGIERVENGLDALYGADANPLKQLGALGWFCYWIVVATGIYLYIPYDSGVTEAYASVEYLTNVQWFAGGIMRSLHRYASDALVAVMLLHMAREFVRDRYRGVRWFAWLTGVAIIGFVYASGITGYWVVWDRLAQYVAVATSEFLDAPGIFGDPIARNFLHPTMLSGRFFTLMVFIHIAVPLILLFVLWLHTQRLALARVNPPRALAVGMLAALVALSVVHPATSQGPADLTTVPATVALDWFYLPFYPLLDHLPLPGAWAVLLGTTAVLALAPWLPGRHERPAARVDPANCNGCARCEADCPYSAITMGPRTDGRPYEQEPRVDPDLCVACGLCGGACPTATPYRRHSALVAGIELPDLPMAALRERALAATARLRGPARVLVVGCEHGPDTGSFTGEDVAHLTLPCIGALPPPFLDFLLARRHADGILLAGCAPDDCQHRLGMRWTTGRIAGVRDPALRGRAPRSRIATVPAGAGGAGRLGARLDAFRRELRAAAARASADA